MTQILIVAEQTSGLDGLVSTLGANGCSITQLTAAQIQALSQPDQIIWELLICESTAPLEGSTLIGHLPCIVVAHDATVRGAVSAMRSGAEDYLALPIDADELMASIEQTMLRRKSAKPAAAEPNRLSIIGESAAMLELKERIERVAATDTPVLLQGESGTGKELTARAIHTASARRARPLITVNCGTIPAQLLEAELFGRAAEPGSAAEQGVQGLVDAAEGGTLFLDDVAALPAEVQARLLRLLQVGEVRPVGSAVAHSADVRVIAATHRDIGKLVDSGQFREDLFYRLNVVLLQLPPLRARGGDIVQLAEWLLAKTTAKLGRAVERFSPEALEALVGYTWPGNVRELANAIERAVILAEAPVISTEQLAISTEPEPSGSAPETQDHTTLEDYFVRFVLDNEEHYTETELAEKLGISRKSLWERRQRLDIPRRKTKSRTPRRADASEKD